MSEQQTRVLSVTELNEYIKAKIETDRLLKNITIKGEISNFTNHYKTGHFYMTIKDEFSSIKAVIDQPGFALQISKTKLRRIVEP